MPRATGNIRAEEVESITVSRPGMTALTGPLHPADLVDMAHSPAYFVAAGVADRRFSWEHAGPEKIADPVIHGLIDKVRVGPPPTENAERYRQGATVTIRTRDGRSVTNTVYAPTGSGLLGIDWADIDAKFRALVPASGLPEDAHRAAARPDPRFPPPARCDPADRIAAPGRRMSLSGQPDRPLWGG